jgi:hypothetical protein
VRKRKDTEALQRLAVVAAAAVEAEELLRTELDVPAHVKAEADRRIRLFHAIWDHSKR